MSVLALLAGILTMWVFMAVIGVVGWAVLNYAAEIAEGYVADELDRHEPRGERR